MIRFIQERGQSLAKMVTIRFPSILSKMIGEKKVVFEAKTMGEALDKLAEIYGERLKEKMFEESGSLNRFLIFCLNGMMIPTDEILTTHLKENDEVAILVVISGG